MSAEQDDPPLIDLDEMQFGGSAGNVTPLWPDASRRRPKAKPPSDRLPGDELHVIDALRILPELKGRLEFDEFALRVGFAAEPPWKRQGETWTDCDTTELAAFLQTRKYSVRSRSVVDAAVQVVARDRIVHPVRRFLEACRAVYDGTPRLSGLFAEYFDARADETYLAATSREQGRAPAALPSGAYRHPSSLPAERTAMRSSTQLALEFASIDNIAGYTRLVRELGERRTEIESRLRAITPSRSPSLHPHPIAWQKASIDSPAAMKKLTDEAELITIELDHLASLEVEAIAHSEPVGFGCQSPPARPQNACATIFSSYSPSLPRAMRAAEPPSAPPSSAPARLSRCTWPATVNLAGAPHRARMPRTSAFWHSTASRPHRRAATARHASRMTTRGEIPHVADLTLRRPRARGGNESK